jgi:membrane-bound ClpP family serine protease
MTGHMLLAGLLAGLAIAAWCGWGFLAQTGLGKRLMGWRCSRGRQRPNPQLVNLTGVTITQLRPSGSAFINGKRVAVISEGTLIDQGASIRVVAVRGPRVVVREM